MKNNRYPDVVRAKFWRIGFYHRMWTHPLTVHFDASSAKREPYPFTAHRTSDQNCASGSRLNFLYKEDAENWGVGDTEYLANQVATAVRIDINGEIPCYADLEWLQAHKPETLHPVIRRRMKKEPVVMLSGADLEKENAQAEFAKHLKSLYPAFVKHDKELSLDISTAFPDYKGKLIITLNKAAWYASFNITTVKCDVFDPLKEKLEKIWSYKSYLLADLCKKKFNLSVSSYSSDYVNLPLAINFPIGSLSIHTSIEKNTEYWYRCSCSEGTYHKHTYSDLQAFDNIINIMKGLMDVSRYKSYVEKMVNTIDMSFIEDQMSFVPIKVSELKPFKPTKLKTIPNKVKETFTDYLLENHRDELLNQDPNNLVTIIEKTLNDDKWRKKYYDYQDISFFYSYFKNEFDVNILDYIKKPEELFRNWSGLRWVFVPDSGKVVISADNLNKAETYTDAGGTIYFEEGITDLSFVMESAYGDDNCLLVFPSTVTGNLKVPFCQFHIKITPIKDENGDLISPFKVQKIEYEKHNGNEIFCI